ncbi:MAG: dUTP diphosphatase [Thiomicrorhabdus sp.]|nr:dUTP diphosphatase [Thiomicrorhabdus sp.]
MKPHKSINEMLVMQSALNDMTNGADWRSGKTALGKVIDWRRCIVMETAELIDSYPWKHWKAVDAATDIKNVRVELVDIWHFLLSLALENFSAEKAAQLLNKGLLESNGLQMVSSELSAIEQVGIHETMMRMALEPVTVSENYLLNLSKAFFDSCKVAELDFEQLHQTYMAKNVLNKFRQDHGYKEGSYIKEWNGKEDNVVMFEIIAQMSDFSGDALYLSLKESYQNIKA